MASNPYVNKVQTADGTTLIDLSQDTVTSASDIVSGKVGHLADGSQVTGTASGSGGTIMVTEEPDSGGGIIKNITAVNISDTTAVASDVASGKVFYTANGTRTTGSSSAIVPSGTLNITTNDTYDVTNYASAVVNVSGGGGMAIQVYTGNDYARAASYTETDVSLTVEKTGTYTVSWVGWRSTSSGTSGSRLYINGNAYGSEYTTFQYTYGQNPILTNVSLTAGDVLVVRARARSSSYYMAVGNLIIQQTA